MLKEIKNHPARFVGRFKGALVKAPIATAVQRYMTELLKSGVMYYRFSSPVALAGDFHIRSTVEMIDGSDGFVVSGGTGATGFEVYRDAGALSRTLAVFYGGVKLGNSTPLEAGKLHVIDIKRAGSTLTLSTKGSVILTRSLTGTCEIGAVGGRPDGTFTFGGHLLDLKVWQAGDENTGQLVLDSPMDDVAGSALIRNASTTLGSPLNIGTLELAGSGALVGNTLTGAGSGWAYLYHDTSTQIGKVYKISVTLRTIGDEAFIRVWDKDNSFTVLYQSAKYTSGVHTAELIVQAGSFATRVSVQKSGTTSGDSLEFISLVMQEIPLSTPILYRINQPVSVTELYTQDGAGRWLGKDLVEQNAVSVWTGSESDYATKTLRSNTALVRVIEKLDLSKGTSGRLKVQSSAGAATFNQFGGVYTTERQHGTSSTFVQTSGGVDKYIGEATVSLKRLLEIVQ